MKGKSSILSSVLILALGVVMIIINKSLKASGVVMCGGILFLLASLFNVFNLMSEDRRLRVSMISQVFGWICSIAGIILGLCMLVFDATFIPLIPYIFGLLLALASVFHFFVLSISYRPVMFPGWMYLFPVVILAGGVWVFFMNAGTSDPQMMIVTGAGLNVFSVAVFIEAGFLHVYNKAQREAASAPKTSAKERPAGKPAADASAADAAPGEVHDVDAREIKSLPEE